MKIGDLVADQWCDGEIGEIGIIVSQVGCVDRWLVYWFESRYRQAYNGCNLEAI